MATSSSKLKQSLRKSCTAREALRQIAPIGISKVAEIRLKQVDKINISGKSFIVKGGIELGCV